MASITRARTKRPMIMIVNNWAAYITRVGGTAARIAATLNISPSTVGESRGWLGGSSPSIEQVRAFAHAYDRPVLEALIAAGYLEPADAQGVTLVGDISSDELLNELRIRLAAVESSQVGTAPEGRMSPVSANPELLRAAIESSGHLSRRDKARLLAQLAQSDDVQ